MRIVVIVTSLLLAAAVIPSAWGKVAGSQRQIDGIRAVKFPEEKIWLLAAAESSGAAGLVAGLLWWPLGAAAAVGLTAYFIGAVGYLARARISQAKHSLQPPVCF
jgi:hypothetical protein